MVQETDAQLPHLQRAHPQTGALPLTRAHLSDGGELDVIHPLRQLKKRRDRRIRDQQDLAFSLRRLFEKCFTDLDISPQMAETQTVLTVNHDAWITCRPHERPVVAVAYRRKGVFYCSLVH